jgi:hypothetical protein
MVPAQWWYHHVIASCELSHDTKIAITNHAAAGQSARTQLRLEKLGRLSYSDTLYRALSLVGSTTTTLVKYVGGLGPGLEPQVNEDTAVITINTIRVQKGKQDTKVIRGILNRSLTLFKAIEYIIIEYIRLRLTDSVDLVFLSVKDRDLVREHLRWLTNLGVGVLVL